LACQGRSQAWHGANKFNTNGKVGHSRSDISCLCIYQGPSRPVVAARQLHVSERSYTYVPGHEIERVTTPTPNGRRSGGPWRPRNAATLIEDCLCYSNSFKQGGWPCSSSCRAEHSLVEREHFAFEWRVKGEEQRFVSVDGKDLNRVMIGERLSWIFLR
jgi:hypothetical protein